MKSLIENKKARLEYEVLETYEAGLALFGFEVKALRSGMGSLVGARVVIRGGEAFLVGATVPPYQKGNAPKSYDPERSRKLLLGAKEIRKLEGQEGQKGLTILPIMVYNNNRRLKLEIAVARHKKKKRQACYLEGPRRETLDRTHLEKRRRLASPRKFPALRKFSGGDWFRQRISSAVRMAVNARDHLKSRTQTV